MFNFLGFLLLIVLIVALVKPKLFSPTFTRKKAALYFGLGVVVLFILGSITSEKEKPKETALPTEQSASARKQVFDVPSLIGKDIDQVRVTLGTPKEGSEPTKQQLAMGIDQWDNTFEKDGMELLVTYNPKTRKVIDFFIPKEVTDANKEELLIVASVKKDATTDRLEFVKAFNKPGVFTGLKIIPNL